MMLIIQSLYYYFFAYTYMCAIFTVNSKQYKTINIELEEAKQHKISKLKEGIKRIQKGVGLYEN